MAKVVKSFNYKRDNNTFVFVNSVGARQDLTAEGDTDSAADAVIIGQIQAKVNAAQGNLNELETVLTAAGS